MSDLFSDSTGNGMASERRVASDSIMSAIEDPFVSSSSQEAAVPRESHRYSSFDTQLFSLNASSPAQAKRALEAHLAETERRLEEASKLGTALIEQQKELEDKLKEVERQQDEGEIGPELRRKLADLEQEYNDIGRETARTFLAPKREEGHMGTPSFDGKVQHSATPPWFKRYKIRLLTLQDAVAAQSSGFRQSSYQLSQQSECPVAKAEEPTVEPCPRYRICYGDLHVPFGSNSPVAGAARRARGHPEDREPGEIQTRT
jgi:hypothetical protein